MDYSVFFYTYSTIAQTLAGALGFLTAVVLYRMQLSTGTVFPILEARRGQALKTMQRFVDQGQTMDPARVEQYWDIERMQRGESERVDSIKAHLIYALYPTAGVVALCLFAMPLTPTLCKLAMWAASVPLVIAVAGALTCLILYVRLVIDVIRPFKNPTLKPAEKPATEAGR